MLSAFSYTIGKGLLVVVGLTFYYSTRAIDLLGEGEANHLVGESHLGEAELFVGTLVDGW